MRKNKPLTTAAFFAGLLFISACSMLPDWLGSGEKEKLPGERYAVMDNSTTIAADPTMAEETIDIPEAIKTSASNGSSSGNYYLEGDLSQVKTVDAGEPPQDEFFLYYPPAIADNTVYIIDGQSNISAYDAQSLSQKWFKKADAPKKDADLPGGGISEAYGVLYAATGFGEVVAVSAADGSQIWKKNLSAPLRRPPVVVEDKVLAVTIDNQLFALSAIDGQTLWRHAGAKENTSFYGSANPSVKGDVAVVAYSSGEVFGIGTSRGNELWTELMSLGNDRKSAAATLNDVNAAPVIIDGIAYVSGRSGDLNAFNAANGSRIWQQKLGVIDITPWVAGRYIYTIAQGDKLVALNRFDGRIKWIGNLPAQDKDEETKNHWSGLVMAGGKLLITGSSGKLLQADPAKGELLKITDIPKGVYGAPAIAGGKLYLLTREAQLVQVR